MGGHDYTIDVVIATIVPQSLCVLLFSFLVYDTDVLNNKIYPLATIFFKVIITSLNNKINLLTTILLKVIITLLNNKINLLTTIYTFESY